MDQLTQCVSGVGTTRIGVKACVCTITGMPQRAGMSRERGRLPLWPDRVRVLGTNAGQREVADRSGQVLEVGETGDAARVQDATARAYLHGVGQLSRAELRARLPASISEWQAEAAILDLEISETIALYVATCDACAESQLGIKFVDD